MNDIPAPPNDTPEPIHASISTDERNVAVLAHLSGLCGALIPLGGVAAPVLIWFLQKDKSAYIEAQAKSAINFQITAAFAFVACLILMVIGVGFLLLPLVGLAWLVMMGMAATAVSRGEDYRYPVTLELLK